MPLLASAPLAVPTDPASNPDPSRRLSNVTTLSAPDEDVGSLPMVKGDKPLVDAVPRGLRDKNGSLKPFLLMTGFYGNLRDAVLAADGKGAASLQPWLDDSVLMGFHGEVVVDLALAMLSESIDLGVWLGPEFLGGALAVEVDGVWTSIAVIDSVGTFSLPLGSLAAQCNGSELVLHVVAPSGKSMSLTSTFGLDDIKLTQSHFY